MFVVCLAATNVAFMNARALAAQGEALAVSAKGALMSQEGRAIMARALENPNIAQGVARILGVSEADAIFRSPETVRQRLLEKLSKSDARTERRVQHLLGPAIQSTASSGSGALAVKPGANVVKGQASSEFGEVFESAPKGSKTDKVLLASQGSGGPAATPEEIQLGKDLLQAYQARAERGEIESITLAHLQLALMEDPHLAGEGALKGCKGIEEPWTPRQALNWAKLEIKGAETAGRDQAKCGAMAKELATLRDIPVSMALADVRYMASECQYFRVSCN